VPTCGIDGEESGFAGMLGPAGFEVGSVRGEEGASWYKISVQQHPASASLVAISAE
jgi:hypothetical protein